MISSRLAKLKVTILDETPVSMHDDQSYFEDNNSSSPRSTAHPKNTNDPRYQYQGGRVKVNDIELGAAGEARTRTRKGSIARDQ